jgi:enoyl-CoA hydratase/carnithine racemase
MAQYQEIITDVADKVATITLNRPEKLNAWTGTIERELREAMHAAAADPNVNVIVLTGAGRGFCAGADMGMLTALGQGAGRGDGGASARSQVDNSYGAGARDDFRLRYAYFPTIPKPIIAAINGPCAGLGMVVSLYADWRIAADSARFSTAFARRGLIAEHGISWMLPRLVGPAQALELLMSARLIDAREALDIGLVSRVLPTEGFGAAVHEIARDLASTSSPRSTGIIKAQVWNGLFQNLDEATRLADAEMVKCFDTEDFREGVAHFLEKRAPAFTGR